MRPRRPRPAGAAAPDPAGIRAAALALLARRDYTAAELRDRLERRGFPPAAAADAVRDLETSGTVDDRRVAAAHVRTALGVKGRGRRRIARELDARGVDEALARALLGEVEEEDEAAAVARLVARAGGRPATLAARQRLFQRLLRRGFPAALIARVLRP